MRITIAATLVAALATGRASEALADGVAWTAPFNEVSKAAGVGFRHSFGDDRISNIVEISAGGCGLVDIDGDGYLDVILLSGRWTEGVSDPKSKESARHANATNRLYHNQGDGTFVDATSSSGIAGKRFAMGVVAADYDGDGDVDLYVCAYGPNELYRNNGDGTFTEVAADTGLACESWSMGGAFLDHDGDGDLDLYVANYLVFDPDYTLHYAPDRFPGPLAYEGSPDVLYRNNGDGSFTDITREADLLRPQNRSMGICAGDFNGDGRQDIFVSNDAMANALFRNDGDGTYTEVSLESGVAYGQNGDATAAMGARFVDYDADGKLDLYVPDDLYSCLYRNLGDGIFTDATVTSGIAPIFGPFVGWGPGLGDFDMNGTPDLYVATGGLHRFEPMSQLIFGNLEGRFLDVSEDAGDFFAGKRMARGVAAGDYDNDGDIDLLVLNLDDAPALLRNDQRTGRHWLRVQLEGSGRNSDAIGARVRITRNGRDQYAHVESGGGYASQDDVRLHFGLDTDTRVERLEVSWPNGGQTLLEDVAADQTLTIKQPLETAETP